MDETQTVQDLFCFSGVRKINGLAGRGGMVEPGGGGFALSGINELADLEIGVEPQILLGLPMMGNREVGDGVAASPILLLVAGGYPVGHKRRGDSSYSRAQREIGVEPQILLGLSIMGNPEARAAAPSILLLVPRRYPVGHKRRGDNSYSPSHREKGVEPQILLGLSTMGNPEVATGPKRRRLYSLPTLPHRHNPHTNGSPPRNRLTL